MDTNNIRIEDGLLNENLKDGAILPHTVWNQSMQVIKEAVNANFTDIQGIKNTSIIADILKTIPGYSENKIQVIKNVNGTVTWVDEV